MASSSMDSSIIIWKTSTDLIKKYELNGHLRQAECLAVLNDGNLASGSDDFTIKIWNSSDSFKNVFNLTGHVQFNRFRNIQFNRT